VVHARKEEEEFCSVGQLFAWCHLGILSSGALSLNHLNPCINTNTSDDVYGAVIMARALQELPGSFDECRTSARWPPNQANPLGLRVCQ